MTGPLDQPALFADLPALRRQAAADGFAHDRTEGADTWYTPPEIFLSLKLDFDLDPASPAGGLPWIPARRFFSLLEDGLTQPWHGRVWLNPPYGDETPRWLERLARHGNGIALVFARTDTGWFHEIALRADRLCFVRGRISFLRSDHSRGDGSGAGSLFLAFGADCAAALDRAKLGWTVTP